MNATHICFLNVASTLSLKKTRVFANTEDVCIKYDITRGDEIHTKHFDVPTPSRSKFRIDDELEPSRYIFIKFDGIHDSYYIGINQIEFYDIDGNEISYKNIEVDGKKVDDESVKPAFPPNGWWAVVGETHSLVFDFGDIVHVKYVYMWCANAASTPRLMSVTDAISASSYSNGDNVAKFDMNQCIQLGGKVRKDPSKLCFLNTERKEQSRDNAIVTNFTEIIKSLNKNPPLNGFESYLTTCGCHFVFYREGLRTTVINYYLGKDHSSSIRLLNNTKLGDAATIEDVAQRAMTLQELRAVRAFIVSNCVKYKWKSSRDGSPLRPEDVNLYDLNELIIKPLTKKRKCSFKELFSSGGAKPTYYVSHWWGEKVLDFILCCEYHAMCHNLDPSEAKYWVCAYANRQHDLGTDLGTDPSKSSFNKAMMSADGVFLVIDPKVVVTSRIWVDYELYRTIKSYSMLDFGIYNRGKVHLIADKALDNETPYQKNQREKQFPFEEVSKNFLSVELHKGESSQEIDRVRILNVMSESSTNLDDPSILKRITQRDAFDPKYLSDMANFMKSDSSLRAAMAKKVVSVSLSTENQSLENFYGHNLLDIIATDKSQTELVLVDLVSLDSVTDDVFNKIVSVVGPNIKKFVLNVCGCKNLTDACLLNLTIPTTLEHLALNVGYAKNLTNEAILHLTKILPQELESLDLNVSGFKTPDGTYAPPRYNSHMEILAKNIPPKLKHLKFVTHLEGSENFSGFLTLVKSLPRDLKGFEVVFESWEGFRSDDFIKMLSNLPSSIEILSLTQYGGYYIQDEDMKSFAKEIKTKFTNITEFYLHTRSNAEEVGNYQVRHIESIHDLYTYA